MRLRIDRVRSIHSPARSASAGVLCGVPDRIAPEAHPVPHPASRRRSNKFRNSWNSSAFIPEGSEPARGSAYHNKVENGEAAGVTRLLAAWRAGDEQAARELVGIVYAQLRELAGIYLRNERDPMSLQPTALVNELYISLFAGKPVECEDRLHFLHIAARQMRHLVIDYARRRKNLKRGGNVQILALDEARDHAVALDAQLTDLDEALDRLEKMDERSAQIVELRFFGGLTEEEIATLLDISVPTVKRDWHFARTWLLAQLSS